MSNQQRMYNVVFKVTDRRLGSFGSKKKANATSMTHKEACTFKSKMMNYDHGHYMLDEIKTNFIFATGNSEPFKKGTGDRRFMVVNNAKP